MKLLEISTGWINHQSNEMKMKLTETTVGWFHTHLKDNIRYSIKPPRFDISTVSIKYLTLRIVR